MVRTSKKEEIKNRCPKRCRAPAIKTGPKPDAITYKTHTNAIEGEPSQAAFIPKIK